MPNGNKIDLDAPQFSDAEHQYLYGVIKVLAEREMAVGTQLDRLIATVAEQSLASQRRCAGLHSRINARIGDIEEQSARLRGAMIFGSFILTASIPFFIWLLSRLGV